MTCLPDCGGELNLTTYFRNSLIDRSTFGDAAHDLAVALNLLKNGAAREVCGIQLSGNISA
jgi:hypothetical protein